MIEKTLDAWGRLQQTVSDHDRPGTDELLVTAGAPIGIGFGFPSDLVTAALVLEKASEGATLEASQIRKVYVHAWPIRSIDLLQPGVEGVQEIASDAEVLREINRGFFTRARGLLELGS